MWGGNKFRGRVFNPAKTRAELDTSIFHDVRHTYASLLIAANVQPMVVAEQLGHTDARLVLQRYGHLYPGAAAQAAMALDLYLKAAAVGQMSAATARGTTRSRKRRHLLMERAGLEPATPSLQSWCSPN